MTTQRRLGVGMLFPARPRPSMSILAPSPTATLRSIVAPHTGSRSPEAPGLAGPANTGPTTRPVRMPSTISSSLTQRNSTSTSRVSGSDDPPVPPETTPQRNPDAARSGSWSGHWWRISSSCPATSSITVAGSPAKVATHARCSDYGPAHLRASRPGDRATPSPGHPHGLPASG